MSEHFFQLIPATFPKEEGALMQVAWWLAICEDMIAEEIRTTPALAKRLALIELWWRGWNEGRGRWLDLQ